MHYPKVTSVASAALGGLAVAAITLAATAPASAATPGSSTQIRLSIFVNEPVETGECTDATSTDCNPGDPAGGTGAVAGPQSEADVVSGPGVDANAGGTGLDSGPQMPPDVQTDPGLADGGQPAGGIG